MYLLAISGNVFNTSVGSIFSSLVIMAVVLIGGIFLVRAMNSSPVALTALVIVIVAVGYYLFGDELLRMIKGY